MALSHEERCATCGHAKKKHRLSIDGKNYVCGVDGVNCCTLGLMCGDMVRTPPWWDGHDYRTVGKYFKGLVGPITALAALEAACAAALESEL